MIGAGMTLFGGNRTRIAAGWRGSTTSEHRHKLWFVLAGSARHAVADAEVIARSGHAYFLPGQPRQSWRCDGYLEVCWFHFRAESLVLDRRLARVAAPRSWPLARWAHWRPWYLGIAEYFRDRDELLGLRLQAMAAEIAADVLTGEPDAEDSRERARLDRFAPALSLMDSGFARNLAVAPLAAAAGLSVVHFHREFTRLFRLTPHAYMQRRRIELAQELLRSTADPIAAIAARCGYDDPFYFARVFRRATGRSPSAFRADPRQPDP